MITFIIIMIVLLILLILNNNINGIYILNYFLGLILIIFLNDLKYDNVYIGQGGNVLILMFDLFYYSLLYTCSLLYLLFDLKKRKIYYFIIPFLVYFLILGYIFSVKKYYLGGNIFIAYFPVHIYSYFKLKKIRKL